MQPQQAMPAPGHPHAVFTRDDPDRPTQIVERGTPGRLVRAHFAAALAGQPPSLGMRGGCRRVRRVEGLHRGIGQQRFGALYPYNVRGPRQGATAGVQTRPAIGRTAGTSYFLRIVANVKTGLGNLENPNETKDLCARKTRHDRPANHRS
jgi:hypothetical protein